MVLLFDNVRTLLEKAPFKYPDSTIGESVKTSYYTEFFDYTTIPDTVSFLKNGGKLDCGMSVQLFAIMYFQQLMPRLVSDPRIRRVSCEGIVQRCPLFEFATLIETPIDYSDSRDTLVVSYVKCVPMYDTMIVGGVSSCAYGWWYVHVPRSTKVFAFVGHKDGTDTTFRTMEYMDLLELCRGHAIVDIQMAITSSSLSSDKLYVFTKSLTRLVDHPETCFEHKYMFVFPPDTEILATFDARFPRILEEQSIREDIEMKIKIAELQRQLTALSDMSFGSRLPIRSHIIEKYEFIKFEDIHWSEHVERIEDSGSKDIKYKFKRDRKHGYKPSYRGQIKQSRKLFGSGR
jgi:hypothetical protein